MSGEKGVWHVRGCKGQNEPLKNAKRLRIIRNVPIPSPNHLLLLQSNRKQDSALDYQMFGLFIPGFFFRFVASGVFRQPIVVAKITAGKWTRRVGSAFSEFLLTGDFIRFPKGQEVEISQHRKYTGYYCKIMSYQYLIDLFFLVYQRSEFCKHAEERAYKRVIKVRVI